MKAPAQAAEVLQQRTVAETGVDAGLQDLTPDDTEGLERKTESSVRPEPVEGFFASSQAAPRSLRQTQRERDNFVSVRKTHGQKPGVRSCTSTSLQRWEWMLDCKT